MGTLDLLVLLAYFVGIVVFGSYFARFTRTTRDFFMGGQRFSWWLIASSCVATVVGSYSFIKYSKVGYDSGFSSTEGYLNDVFLMPLWMFGWLPIIYYSRVTSIPEYFERRFGRKVRVVALCLMLVYLVGYLGINYYTLGTALKTLLDWDLMPSAIASACVTAIYSISGGQTAVLMTDLVQGGLLLVCGLSLLALGLWELGGLGSFLDSLPLSHLAALPAFNDPAGFNFIGVFWQDAMANTAAFYFMHQGVMLRFLSARSVREGRRAMFAILLILMPVAAVAVSCGGWIGQGMVSQGMLQAPKDSNEIFVLVAKAVSFPGMFGLLMAALMAALMSTADTLANAASSIAVNDIWKPFVRPDAGDAHYLKVARVTTLLFCATGLALVPVFAADKSIFLAHGKFTAAITPPLVVVILMGAFWKRFNATAAMATLVGGSAFIVASLFWPGLIAPFDHGVALKGYKYMRALFGLVASILCGVAGALLTEPQAEEEVRGLVSGTLESAREQFKGSPVNDRPGRRVYAELKLVEGIEPGDAHVSPADAQVMGAAPRDRIFVEDARLWLGGLISANTSLVIADDCPEGEVWLAPQTAEDGSLEDGHSVRLEKLM